MNRRRFLRALAGGAALLLTARAVWCEALEARIQKLDLDDAQWRKRLTPAQFDILRRGGTEEPFSSPLTRETRKRLYSCAGCGLPLFPSEFKYDSRSGWPSFFNVLPGNIQTRSATRDMVARLEYHCARCGGHQGHILDDGPQPKGLHFSNNGIALRFLPASENRPRERGFTLLEISVVLAIIGLVLGSGLTILTANLQARAFNATAARMDAIEKALLDYAVAFNRIPCPANLALPQSDTNYGVEAAVRGACTGGTPSASFTAGSGTVEGAVPTRALQLPDDYMYDAWGRRLRYAVDPIYTKSAALPINAGGPCSPSTSAITVYDTTRTARTTAAIYALVSHGANGHGAYSSAGNTVSNGSINVDELTNCHCGSNGWAGTYTPNYVEKVPMQDPANGLNSFDDLVTFKEAWQMQAQNFPLTLKQCPVIYIADEVNGRIRTVPSNTGTVSTIAGSAAGGYGGDGGPATSAALTYPAGTAFDSRGNMYIGDLYNYRIRKVAAQTGIITTFAGNGTSGFSGDGGPATGAEFAYPGFIAVDSADNVYVADRNNQVIRKIAAGTGIITTVAGTGTLGYSGDGGPATSATFAYPSGIAFDSGNNLYIADYNNQLIRKVAGGTGIITTVVGSGSGGYSGDGGPATSASMYLPTTVAVDSNNNIYVADYGNNRVRMVAAATGIITTVAGNGTMGYSGDGGPATSAQIGRPSAVGVDVDGNIYFGDVDYSVVRKVTASTGIISTFAGTGTYGYSGDGGPARSAQFTYPMGLSVVR